MNKSTMSRTFINKSKYTLSRRGKKLTLFEDSKMIIALPKDIPERTWTEIFQKEECDLMIFDIREEIFETACNIVYEHYMQKQNVAFTVHCAIKAWLKIIDWYFYRHDPGEEVSASPACFIPKREASWQPDEPPEPSPRDPFCRQRLVVLEDESKDIPREVFSCTSLDYPTVDEIPEECWFPGRVDIKTEEEDVSSEVDGTHYEGSAISTFTSEDNLAAESEVLQKVTDYGSEKALKVDSTKKLSRVGQSTVTVGSGETSVKSAHLRRPPAAQPPLAPSQTTRSRGTLPPLSSDSQSRLSIISDCRLRNLRLDTHYEVSSEKMDLSPVENVKRK